MPAMPGEIENDHTSELVYPVTVVFDSFSPGREVSYACGNRALIASERTSKLADPATVVLNSFTPRGEISHACYAWGIENERTSELAYPATVVYNSFSPRRERLAMPAMPVE